MTTNSDKLRESVRTLKQLYGVVIGVGLTTAIRRVLDEPSSGLVSVNWKVLPWVGALCITLLPFYHGATRHMDETYVWNSNPPRAGAILLDYALLVLGAMLFFWLSLMVGDPHLFKVAYVALLGLDVVWAGAAVFLVNAGKFVVRWLLVNVATIAAIGVVHYTPILDSAPPEWLAALAVVRTVVDYCLCWGMYFPEATSSVGSTQ